MTPREARRVVRDLEEADEIITRALYTNPDSRIRNDLRWQYLSKDMQEFRERILWYKSEYLNDVEEGGDE